MSNENLQKPYKQRFKGVENFLRRVAFNLGNTASQTEVKIISCIPIDVTDLQQKIINLEKQLHEAKQPGVSAPVAGPSTAGDKGAASDAKPAAVVNTALYGSSFGKQSSTVSYCSDKLENIKSHQVATHCGDCTSRHRKSNVSFVFPAISTLKTEQACNFNTLENANLNNDDDTNIAVAERYMNIFKKRKRKRACKGKSKMKTHLVYFAQHTQNNPFNMKEIKLNHYQTLDNKDSISHTFLDNVIRRQYDPKFAVEEFSDTSNFSKPICRDTADSYRRSGFYESDVCSCCHGRFQNIDNYMTKSFDPINKLTQYNRNTNKIYYDSNLYDVIPVKENTNKYVKDDVFTKRNIEIRCWPENFRSKYRYNPIIVNYQADIPHKRRADKISPQKIKHKENIDQGIVKQKRISKQDQQTGIDTSKSCCIDCGDIYKKENLPITKLQKAEPVKTILLKHELIETDDINTKLLLTNQSTQLELIPDDNKTESTLDQIKSILQSVLAEVKTSTKVNTAPEIKQKKDAIVQKGASQNNMQGDSTLLHSFTYNNSYNANPYLPSCSRQIPTAQYCFTGAPYQQPLKCLQNFPVFIHPATGRPMCACYYRSSSHKSSHNKHATTAATNTDNDIQRASSKETENLIKEIYKSIALNMDFPTKDNSVSEYDDLKSAENVFINDHHTKNVKSTSIEVVDKRDIEIEALISPNISNNSKLVYTATSSQSEDKERTSKLCKHKKPVRNEANHDKISHGYEQHSTDTILEDSEETHASTNETENEDFVNIKENSTQRKNKKKGLFHRMFRSVKLFKKRKVNQKLESESEEEISDGTDSDDYETVYSDRTAIQLPEIPRCQNYKRKVYLKPKSLDQNATHEKARRSPYLEQEYRRQWNERLMFEKQQDRNYSSEQPFSKQSNSNNPRPLYWNNYEARSAMVQPNSPTELKYLNNAVSKNLKDDKLTRSDVVSKEKLGWLKKHKLGIHCGEQWKKFLLEN